MAGADDIPSGLYPIRTRCASPEEPSSSGGGDEKLAGGAARRDAVCEKGYQKGRKIARWLTSHITRKNSNKASDDMSSSAKVNKSVDRRDLAGRERFLIDHNNLSQKISLLESGFHNRTRGKKSFSHELGPKGGIRPSLLRAHSYSDLKDLLGSLHSKFDAAREAVNGELAAFIEDLRLALESESFSNTRGKAEDLLILSQQCIEMTSGQFRESCESFVQNLSERRHQCEAGLLRQLVTRMLFILTRCTRILQFQKDSGPINEDSFESFKQCLESVPAVEMNWVPKPKNVDFSLDNTVKQEYFSKHQSKEENKNTIPSTESCSTLTDVWNVSSSSYRKVLPSYHQNSSQGHQAGGHSSKKLMEESPWDLFDEQDRYSEDVDSVVCRICEKSVPASHLESHSYICAYADKCNLEGTNLDDCLLNIAEVLEQIMEIYNQSVETSYSSPEISRIRSTYSAVGSAVHSPKVQEWHSKGLEGMFEDIHEMETASIDDFYYGSSSYMKGYLDMKLGLCGPGSSNGIMTPISSTNSPRLSHFDLFWLEHNNQSEREDIHQIIEMADIARRAMNIDVASEGASEILAMCMQDLVNVLLHNPLKALVIDTFGSRIKDLLKEKYLLSIGLLNKESFINTFELEDCRGHPLNNGSDYTVLASLQSSHKERTSIDDFEIIKPISRGAFGRVFLARKRTTGDLFAIKVLKKLDMIRKNDIERILAERNILITVRNPFVVRFFYSFTCRDNLYLVMEYLNGGDLYSLLRKVDCLTEDVARVYIAELVLALEYLHSLGIIHRDLKPDNILIARDGHIKLTDFGLSKIGLINNSVDLSTSGKNGSIPSDDQNVHVFPERDQQGKRTRRSAVGTPDYLAPEILLGTEHGYAADWWSVGIILFEFLTGIPPFTERLPEIIFDNILNRKIPWPNVPDEMSYEARDLIDRFLVQDPSLRLGAKGASEVKAHPFFKEIDWDNLALQKAAFIPNPDSVDDTSYFLSRYSHGSYQIPVDKSSSDCASNTIDSCSDTSCESKMEDKYSEPMEFDSNASFDLSSISFSFKNLSQLASMNYDVLLQSGRASKCSSPARVPGP